MSGRDVDHPMSEGQRPTLGALIRQAMRARGMRKVDLVQRMERSPTFVHRLIHDLDKYPPPPDVLADLRRALGLSMRDMLTALGYEIESGASPSAADFASDVPREIARAMIDDVDEKDIGMVQGLIQTVISSHDEREEARQLARQDALPPTPTASADPLNHVSDAVLVLF
jgi:hypothetical protein